MKITVDRKKDIMRIAFEEGTYDISEELDNGIIVDLTKNKKIVAIEILDVSEKISLKNIQHVSVNVSS